MICRQIKSESVPQGKKYEKWSLTKMKILKQKMGLNRKQTNRNYLDQLRKQKGTISCSFN